jgi:NAD(P)-dependent dehydrogenase (short-subunit alcohol dehydrogenase family)
MGILDGKTVLVTGGGRGVGRAHAVTAAEQGANVVVNDLGTNVRGGSIEGSPADRVVEVIENAGGHAVADFEDISTWDGAQRAVAHAIDHFGRLDGLVNNAGIVRHCDLADLTEQDVDLVLGVHLKGTFACTVAACRYWREQARAGKMPKASIVNTVSDAMFFAYPHDAPYASAKAGIALLTQAGSREGVDYGVRMNAYGPRAFTRMAASSDMMILPDDIKLVEAGDPDDESPISPRNPSSLVVWLLSDDSDHVTGQVFRTLGGGIAQMTPWLPKDMVWPKNGAYRFDPADVGPALNAQTFGSRFPEWNLDFAPGDPRKQAERSSA